MKHGRRDLACDSRNEEPNTVRSNRTHKVLNTGQEDGEVGDAEEQGPDGNEAAKIIKPGTSANGQGSRVEKIDFRHCTYRPNRMVPVKWPLGYPLALYLEVR